MTASNVVLWRHGRTAWNAEGRLQGQSNIEMDDVGRSQVASAATMLNNSYPNAQIVSSDLKRAAASAQYFAQQTNQPIQYDPRLRERSFGVWEGLTRDEIAVRWPDLFEAWQRGSDALASPPEGESRGAASQRVADAIVDWAQKAPDGTNLVIVSHGAAITGAITYLMGQDPDAWHGISGIDNANWSVIRPSLQANGEQKWRLAAHNVGNTPPSTIYNG